MAGKKGLSHAKMAERILNRDDNIYKKEMIKSVLDMYADEIQKAVMNGERVQITGVGTIIPELRAHMGRYNMPTCNRFEEYQPPSTRVRMTRNYKLRQKMNETLLKNIENGIYGRNKLPFEIHQLNILKKSGYIPDEENE